ncbi:MAG: AAA family ATPase [Myxococcota bacterium]|jgi:hypothetical protein|nr:AAA family ATPase [Myxococcota bacterium]
MGRRLPYGISHFPTIRQGQYLFVDHTEYIRRFEDLASHIVFVRPRRFGKSLWLSILEHYYDLRFAEHFDELFGGLAIADEPTPLHNQFLVLRFDFSAIHRSATEADTERSFGARVASNVASFLATHRRWLGDVDGLLARLAGLDEPLSALDLAIHAALVAELPVMVLVDEYDTFANELIATHQEQRYAALVRGTGLLKTFFKAIKEATSIGVVARSFLTGVSPLLLDDISSGFNIAMNPSLRLSFGTALGFCQNEVAELFGQVFRRAGPSAVPSDEELHALMVNWYNGYRFHPAAEAVFNPDMVLYFLSHLADGQLPTTLLDSNLRTDLAKLQMLVRKGAELGALLSLLEREHALPMQVQSAFGIERLSDSENFHSLLFYLGLLTYTASERPALRIPNYVARTLYWDELRRVVAAELQLDPSGALRDALAALMERGEGEAFFELARVQVLSRLSQRDFLHFNEASLKSVLLSLLSLSQALSVFSEWEVGRGYADLVLVPMPQATWLRHAWMVELKYLKRKQDSAAAREQALATGRAELARYLADESRMSYLGRYQVHAAVALFVGSDELVWSAFEYQ